MSQKRQLHLTINGNSYLVEVADLHASPLVVKVNGKAYTVVVNEQSTVNSQQSTINDEPFTIHHSQFTIHNSITAPMPGNIIRIAVKPGDRVSVGQVLCYLEAMKMENGIRSPRDGVIERVVVGEGTAVAHGDTLFTYK